MIRTPSSNAACASGLVLGSATGAIGLAAVAPGGGALCAHPAVVASASIAHQAPGDLLITSHLFDAIERDARFTGPGGEPHLGLLGELVLGQPRQRLPDGLGVLVVDADL